MGRAKEIIVKVIPSKIANEFVKKNHYSGKFARTSKIHFGCFLDGKMHGVLSYGGSINKKGTLNLVKNTGWNEFLELNRMAFDDYLPKYSESRCIAISIRLIKKNAPHIKWIISFSDGTQCGDGTIYRASGFKLVGINKNVSMWRMPDGEVIASLVFGVAYGENTENNLFKKYSYTRGTPPIKFLKSIGSEQLEGNQLKYIYFIDKDKEKDLTLPILPFSEIDKQGAGMYKGEKITLAERTQAREV